MMSLHLQLIFTSDGFGLRLPERDPCEVSKSPHNMLHLHQCLTKHFALLLKLPAQCFYLFMHADGELAPAGNLHNS